MLRYYLVDVIVFLGAFSAFLLLPLRNEFIYQVINTCIVIFVACSFLIVSSFKFSKRVVEKYNYTKPGQSYCGPNETKQGIEDKIVADETSKFVNIICLYNLLLYFYL